MRAVLPGTRVAEVSDAKLPEVMAVAEIDRFAVTVPLIAGSDPIVTLLPTVTEEMLTGTVPEIEAVTVLPIVTVPAIVCVPVGLAVTVPAIVTVLPTVTVPEMVTALPLSP